MKFKIFLFMFLLLGTACSKTSSFNLQNPEAVIAPDQGFIVGAVEDHSGYQPQGDDPQINLEKSLQEALVKAVVKQGLEGSDYTIETKILTYKPGNAFARWLMPGAGATKLETLSSILDKDGNVIAKIPVERSIGFGGAFTIGAWETVLTEVADEIVLVISKQMYGK